MSTLSGHGFWIWLREVSSGGLESGCLESGGLESGSRATDFGAGSAHACRQRTLNKRFEGSLGKRMLGHLNVLRSSVPSASGGLESGALETGGLESGGLESRATDFGSG